MRPFPPAARLIPCLSRQDKPTSQFPIKNRQLMRTMFHLKILHTPPFT